jgi:membrane-associated phospholipid phosphatase
MPRRALPDTIAHGFPPAPDVRWRDRLFFAGYYLIAFVALGLVVSYRLPSPIDVFARPYAGHGVPIAKALTVFGTFPVYTTISALLLVVGFLKRDLLRPVLISIVTLLAAWQVSDACKTLYHRPRPNYWFGYHEPSYSYPSGHATLVIAFYGFWTAVAWASDLPVAVKRWVRLAFAALAIAIGWARLALGAHYVTDVIGGYLLGATMASLGMIVFRALGPAEASRP